MEGVLQHLINEFDDAELLHKIAESFAQKNQMEEARRIYKKIQDLDQSDSLALRKMQYFQAFNEPEKLRIEELPPLDLITDYN